VAYKYALREAREAELPLMTTLLSLANQNAERVPFVTFVTLMPQFIAFNACDGFSSCVTNVFSETTDQLKIF
jgi:hypothetical protein